MTRCDWAAGPLLEDYHDREWGVPCRDDRRLFEMLTLEGAQAGLSWLTILKKRDRYREVYEGFDPRIVAEFDPARQDQLARDPGIVRHRLKIAASVDNARHYLQVQQEFGGFHRYLWAFVDGRPIQNRCVEMSQVPSTSPVSERLSADLKKRGFKFVGPTVVYAYMQAVGMANDHLRSCPRQSACAALA